MTCKDCLYYEICKDYLIECAEHGEAERINNPCSKFKNKADFVAVVRCPECIYQENMKCTELSDNSGHPLDVAIFDYCSQGVRK